MCLVLVSSRHDRRNRFGVRVRQGVVLLSCLAAAAYFAYHTRYGRHGYAAREEFLARAQLLDFEIRSLESVRSKLARDVALLSPEAPNADIVEEAARDVLGYVRPEERIYLVR